VTVVVERDAQLPDNLTAGRDRVGVRVPTHDLGRQLLRAVAPITATSANQSGNPSVRNPTQLDDSIRAGVAAVLDGGTTDGVESTVVDPGRGIVHRRGALADAVEAWLDEH
jgi:L-threonylcarbamoyladenylate synthase